MAHRPIIIRPDLMQAAECFFAVAAAKHGCEQVVPPDVPAMAFAHLQAPWLRLSGRHPSVQSLTSLRPVAVEVCDATAERLAMTAVLDACPELQAVRFALPVTVDTGNDCLRNCDALTHLDLSGAPSLTAIGDDFLANCRMLPVVDFSLSSGVVERIGSSCLFRCDRLTSLDTRGLSRVRAIGHHFGWGCAALASVDLAGLSGLREILHNFLNQCPSLTTMALGGARHVSAIGYRFLAECPRLTALDFAGYTLVNTVGEGFLELCVGLRELALPDFSSVTTVGARFLFGCTGLQRVDLRGCRSVLSVGDAAFACCKSLTTVMVPPGRHAILTAVEAVVPSTVTVVARLP